MLEFILLLVMLALVGWSAWLDVIWLAGVAVVIYLAGSWLFGDLNHLSFLADPVTLVSLVALSIAVGAAWSLWKWRRWMFGDTVQCALKDGKDRFDKSGGEGAFRESSYFPKIAQPSENVERIVTWIILWPFSMVVYFFEDFLMDVGRWVYNKLGMVYSRITDSALPEDMR